MANPTFSVLVATYHRPEVLQFAIESILAQTYRSYEILVTGDGVTDDTADVVARFNHPRIRWANLSKHGGHQSRPNNYGLSQARGDLIAYLGQDDLWFPNHLESLLEGLSRSDLAYTTAMLIPPDDSLHTLAWAVDFAKYAPDVDVWIPPIVVGHTRALAELVDGWPVPSSTRLSSETLLWSRMRQRAAPAYVRRLTALKFPATMDRTAYAEHKWEQQARWLKRIETEPDLAQTLLHDYVTKAAAAARVVQTTRRIGYDNA